MRTDIMLEIDKETFDEAKQEILKLAAVMEQATQALIEFQETYKAFERRYHPVVYWFLRVFSRKEKEQE